jgi:hypothetical protein
MSKLHDKNCIVVTSGGFEGENKDTAFGSSPEKGIFEISHLSADHEEGDTRVLIIYTLCIHFSTSEIPCRSRSWVRESVKTVISMNSLSNEKFFN